MCGEIRGQRPHGAAPLPTSNRQKIMGKYLVNTYSTIRKTNGDTFRYEGFTKVLSENVVKIAKQANKEVGYKYVGRFKDTPGRYYTKYAHVSNEYSNSEREVIYFVTITKLK